MVETKNVAALPADPSEITESVIEAIRSVNVSHNIDLIRDAARQGAQIVCLNELFPAPYFSIGENVEENWEGFAESAEEGATISELRDVTKELSIVVIAPIYEQAESGQRYNTAVVIEDGEVIGKYRKTHVPHGNNEGGNFTEGYYYIASDEPGQNEGQEKVRGHDFFPVFETKHGNVGVATCFDRHFQYVWQHLENGGAQMVFSPAVTFGTVSEAVWEHEFPTEAVRHGFFVGGSNRKGQEFEGGPTFFGKSYFVGPDGQRLENLSTNPELVIADLDLSQVRGNLSGWNLPENRNDDWAKDAVE